MRLLISPRMNKMMPNNAEEKRYFVYTWQNANARNIGNKTIAQSIEYFILNYYRARASGSKLQGSPVTQPSSKCGNKSRDFHLRYQESGQQPG